MIRKIKEGEINMKDGKLKKLTGKEVEEMRDKKPLPIGIDDFKTIIEEDYYYADKTKMIETLLDDGAKVTLFTRPRRFGKTLNMSMLNYFFNLKTFCKKSQYEKRFSQLDFVNLCFHRHSVYFCTC